MAKYKWQGDKVKSNVAEQATRAVYKAGEFILDESNKKAPKDEGILIQTSGVQAEDGTSHVYYTQKYAPRLHENPKYNFQNGREGKFLEKAALNNHGNIQQYLKDEMEKAFGG